MYQSFYNLTISPSQISSDPNFLWLGANHSEALAVLKYGLIGEKGFLLLTGDVGAGKTTLVNTLLKSLDDTVLVANVTDPSLDLIGFLNHIALSFKIQQRFDRKEDFLIYFRDFLENTCLHNRKKALLIIDEAHKLSRELLEQIRLLSNIERPEKKLISIFFIGQNELNQKLMAHECRALRQRITLNYNIKPLSETETRQYINHRLKVAGTEAQVFDGKAIHEIYRFSGGCPRLINIICDRALLTGYVRGQKKITENIIEECSQEVLLPGERKEDLRFNLPETIRTNNLPPDVERPLIAENATTDRKAENDDLHIKKPEMIHEEMRAKEKSEKKDPWEPALKNKIEKLISCVLLAASFLKSRTKAMGHSVLTAASFCRHSEKKSLIYGALAASMVVIVTLFFPLTYNYFFSGSGHHEPESKALSTPAYAKNNKALTASVNKQDVVVPTDKKSNVQAIREQAALLLTKDTDQAEKLLQKAVKADPQNAMTYYDLGKLYSQKKDHLKAISAYKTAADLNSDSANTFFNLGFTYAAIKDYVQAEQMFLRVTELEPPYLDKAMVNLALVQYKQGKKQQCIENLGKALKMNPDNEKAHKYLEQFATVSGE